MKTIFILGLLCLQIGIIQSQELTIGSKDTPTYVGERTLKFQCPIDGIQRNQLEVWVYYSDDKEQLSKSDCPMGRATCKTNRDNPNMLDCRFYFPHKDHKNPNIILEREREGGEGLTEEETLNFYSTIATPPSFYDNTNYLQYTSQLEDIGAGITDKNPRIINSPKKVYYKVVRKRLATIRSSGINEFVMPRKFTIAYMGDSYASGEGAPNSKSDNWDDNLCHRSQKSGGMLAINHLIKTHIGLSIDVINTTCSGAKIANLISDPQHRHLTYSPLKSFNNNQNSINFTQLELVKNWCNDKKYETIDIILMGIGGNNIGFAPLAESAIDPREWSNFEAAKAETNDLLPTLPQKYDALNTAIRTADFEVGKVMIMNYPNMLYGKDRKLCDGSNNHGICIDLGILLFNHIHFFHNVHTQLNEYVKSSAEKNEWEHIRVSGINPNGLCNCDEPYFNLLKPSEDSQGDFDGAVHPNEDGYRELYKENVYTSLRPAVRDAQLIHYRKEREEIKKSLKEKLKEKQRKQIEHELIQKRFKTELLEKELEVEKHLKSIPPLTPKDIKK